jgi:hypothetical protein
MNKMKISTVVVLLFASVVTNAQTPVITNVSGSFDAGTVITITGNGFGTKIPARPFLWDDFEGGTAGQPIGDAQIGHYTRTTNSAYSDRGAYSGSLCSYSLLSAATHATFGGEMGLISNWIPNLANNAFASMKIRFAGNTTPSNIKGLRLNSSFPDPPYGYPCFDLGKDRTVVYWQGIVEHGWLDQVYFGGFSALPDPQAWNSLSIWDHMSSPPDALNGFAGRELNGVSIDRHGINTMHSHDDMMGLRAAWFCGYISYEGVDVELYLDDVYADTTMSRVIVRAPTGTATAMQIPQTWSQTSIQILVNTGAYPTGTSLELIVYDADDNASPAFTVTDGETSSGRRSWPSRNLGNSYPQSSNCTSSSRTILLDWFSSLF